MLMETVIPKVLVFYMVGISLFIRWEEMYLHCATLYLSFFSIAVIKYPDSDLNGGGFIWL